jgi:hypothetical protein
MNDFVETHHAVGEQLDVINVNRSGALNKALVERLTVESVSDDWETAKHEWRATGNTWYIPLRDNAGGRLPPEHLSKHPHYCICGHEIAWHFEIENTENGKLEILGSEHITNWMIIRHLIENKGMSADTITEELIQEWMKEAVKSMKAEWWWNEYGDEWEELFNEVKELDLRVNVRNKGNRYSHATRRYEPQYVVAKTKKGSLGNMASVVWRWNHPNNSRRQIETRGYPNEKLWRDVQLLFAKKERFTKMMDNKDEERNARMEYINPTKVIAKDIKASVYQSRASEAIEEALALYDLPPFTVDDGRNDWEKNFIESIINQVMSEKELSEKQLNVIMKIIGDKNGKSRMEGGKSE